MMDLNKVPVKQIAATVRSGRHQLGEIPAGRRGAVTAYITAQEAIEEEAAKAAEAAAKKEEKATKAKQKKPPEGKEVKNAEGKKQ